MIEVFPKFDVDKPAHNLITQFIFKDSKGNRQVLSPAASLDSVGKTPQEFDGEDYAVAVEIMKHVDAKTVTLGKGDKTILVATLERGPAVAGKSDQEPDKKATKKEIKVAVADALAEAKEEHETAAGEAADAAIDAQSEAVKLAIAESDETHQEAVNALNDEHEKALARAAK